MFEKLIDVVLQGWSILKPGFIVRDYEGCVVLRLGKYHRTVSPGFHLKWPLIESDLITTTAITTLELRPQTLTTLDNKSIVISAVVKYQIKDVKPFLLEIWDSVDVLKDVTMGAIRQTVSKLPYASLNDPTVETTVLELVRKEVNQFGFKIYRITFADLGEIRSLRLIGELPHNAQTPTHN
jgi:regulator of protease activity HflC (stomatin/prohibitin superfamily)